jgi:hypothetical protein
MADVKLAYGSSAALTIDLSSLASSSSLVAGRESTAIDNTSNKYLDCLVGGKIKTGTTPTVNKTIQIWVYGSINDSPTYPDVLDGTDSAETITSAEVRNGAIVLLHSVTVTATSDVDYWFAPRSVANCFGGVLPKFWGIFVTHDTVAALHATAGNHVLSYTPVYETVA